MATIAATPFVLKDIILTIGTDDYQAALDSVVFTPTMQQVTWAGLTPSSTFTDTGTPTWTCTLSGAQDWVTANSLVKYLLANYGTSKTCVFKPQGTTTGKPIVTATIILAPPTIGGAQGKVAVFSVTCGVSGAPVLTAAP